MIEPTDLEALRDEALRKVGRNVVNFQKVEACLKFLLAVSETQTTKDGLSARHRKRTATIQKLPMGYLSNEFFRCVYGPESEAPTLTDFSQITVSTTFRVDADAANVKEQKKILSALVTERNKLIHRDLSGFDHNSISSCRNLIAMLDEQNVRVLSQLEQLAALVAEIKAYVAALMPWAEGDGPD
jgi:aerobic-type carbon monoxide dehydrogenase small subunit (CoxS/CutS family)